MLKQYPKTFENVFTDRRKIRNFGLDKVTIKDFITNEKFAAFAKVELRKMMDEVWLMIAKAHWLSLHFIYNGEEFESFEGRSKYAMGAMTYFFNEFSSADIKFFTKPIYIEKLMKYYEDFYPEFSKKDPFKEPEYYKFPYKNIGVNYLIVVYQMPERLDILEYADEHDMRYCEFLDYVINYIFSYNQEHDKDVFQFSNALDYAMPYPYVVYKNYKGK